MLLISLDKSSAVPIYRQICDRIAVLVEEGSLRPGEHLPPTRALAGALDVHRSTIVRAYDELRALGYLESTSGAYTTVRRRARPPLTALGQRANSDQTLVDWDALTTSLVHGAHEHAGVCGPAHKTIGAGMIDLDRLSADPSMAPDDELKHCLKSILSRDAKTVLDYTDPAGWPALRETISQRLRAHGMAVSPQEVLVTNGAQQALDLILRMLTRPGDRVVVEAPTYGMAHTLLRLHGVRPIEIPLLNDGMDLDRLRKCLGTKKPKLVYTMPNFHNPAGVTTDQPHRERLLDLVESAQIPLVEDGFEEELKYWGQAVLPIKSMDAGGVVLYIGTFSKVVFAGLRVGWIAAPRRAIKHLTLIQHATCLAGNTMVQAALARFCRSGGFESYLRRAHRVYRSRMAVMLRSLKTHMPPSVQWTKPTGGCTVWLTVPKTLGDEAFLIKALRQAGVLVAPGRRYFARKRPEPHLRLSIACAREEEIEMGCRRIGRTLARLAERTQ
ncbi:MAG: PLP-dependent aminotransferase family protein [Myxococcota bacterium]|nr:PLP-dependent aminotransferase family protein [Myxococcota bacterium]